MPSKYKAIPTYVDGYRFPSKLESKLYIHLRNLRDFGYIEYFLMQVPVRITADVKMVVDFMVVSKHEGGGQTIDYVDAKGHETREFRIKRLTAKKLYDEHVDVQLVSDKDIVNWKPGAKTKTPH